MIDAKGTEIDVAVVNGVVYMSLTLGEHEWTLHFTKEMTKELIEQLEKAVQLLK